MGIADRDYMKVDQRRRPEPAPARTPDPPPTTSVWLRLKFFLWRLLRRRTG